MLCHVRFQCTISRLKRKTYWNCWAYWQWVHWHHVFNGDVDEKLWWWSQVCRPHSSSLQLQAFPLCYAWQWAIPLHSHIISTIEITLIVPDHVHFFCLYRPSPSKHKLTDSVFMAEFPDFLKYCNLCCSKFLILRDFNIHFDSPF